MPSVRYGRSRKPRTIAFRPRVTCTEWRARTATCGAGRSQDDLLRDHLMNYVSRNVGKPELPPQVTVREPGVVESEQMQQRRLQIVYVDRILRHTHTQLIRL